MVERHEPPTASELDALLDGLRGEIELPVPAASAVKIGGERAYRLARRGVAVELPVRRSTVHALELVAAGDGLAELRLHVSSGTYVRSLAAALGGHCASLRRTAVGPFGVEEADPDLDRLLAAAAALAQLPPEALAQVAERLRAQVRVGAGPAAAMATVMPARGWGGLDERRPFADRARAAAASGRDRDVRRCPRRPPRRRRRGRRGGAHPDRRHVRPAPARGARLRRRAALDARAAARAARGARRRRHPRRRVHPDGCGARAGGVPASPYVLAVEAWVLAAGESFRFGRGRTGDLALCERLGLEVRIVPLVPGVSSTEIRRLAAAGEVRAAAPLLGRPGSRSREPSSPGTPAAARSASRPPTCASTTRSSSPATASTPAPPAAIAPPSRSASTRTTAAPSAGSRPSCSTSRATSTASGWWSSCGSVCGTRRSSRASRS